MNLSLDIFNLFGNRGIIFNDNPNGSLYYYRTPPEYQPDPLYGSASSVYGVRTFRIGVRFSY